MNLFHAKRPRLFLHKGAAPRDKGEFDVVLSPQYYWIKKLSLPVKRVSDAKKLAESIFEGSLPEGVYSYDVSKAEDGDFVLIAYDRARISEALQHILRNSAKAHRIYFAQYACKDLDACCSIDEMSSLVNLDGLLMQIPRNCTDPKLTIDEYLQNRNISASAIKLGSLDVEVIDRRTFVLLAASVVLFLGALGIEYVDYKKATSQLEARKQALMRQYDLPPTTMQLESIKKRLFKTFKVQKRIREALYQIVKVTLGKESYIKSIDINDKVVEVAFVLSQPEKVDSLKSQLYRNLKIIDSSVEKNILYIKIAV